MHLKTNRCPLLLIIANPYLYFKDVVRKLLFNDYFLGLKYWGNAERMYEECCVGFR